MSAERLAYLEWMLAAKNREIDELAAEHPHLAKRRQEQKELAIQEEARQLREAAAENRRYAALARALREEADRKTENQRLADEQEAREDAARRKFLARLSGPRVVERDETGRMIRLREVKQILTDEHGLFAGVEEYDD